MNQSQFNQINHLTQFNHLTKELRKIDLFIQNKPNLPNTQINASSCLTKDYANVHIQRRTKNKPKQTQFKAKTKPKQTQIKANFTPIVWALKQFQL